MSFVLAGRELLPASEVCERLDIRRDTLRNWYAPRRGAPRLRPITRGQMLALLAAAGIAHYPAWQRLVGAAGPTNDPVVVDREYLFDWADVLDAEREAATSGRGRPRRAGYADRVANRGECGQYRIYR